MKNPKTLVLSHTWVFDRTVDWQRAISLVLAGRATVVNTYEDNPISLGGGEVYPRPAIIRYNSGIHKSPRRRVRYSRKALYVRDHGRCQYCDDSLTRSTATVDHIVPRAQGGKTTWENVALSCGPCNLRKADRTPEQAGMPILRSWLVKKPSPDFVTRQNLEALLQSEIPEEWEPWVIDDGRDPKVDNPNVNNPRGGE